MLIFISKHFFYITTLIIYFNMLCYKKNVHIKINAILNKTNILQYFLTEEITNLSRFPLSNNMYVIHS